MRRPPGVQVFFAGRVHRRAKHRSAALPFALVEGSPKGPGADWGPTHSGADISGASSMALAERRSRPDGAVGLSTSCGRSFEFSRDRADSSGFSSAPRPCTGGPGRVAWVGRVSRPGPRVHGSLGEAKMLVRLPLDCPRSGAARSRVARTLRRSPRADASAPPAFLPPPLWRASLRFSHPVRQA